MVCPAFSPPSIRVDAKLSLSTASPNIGGVPPKLDTCKLTLLHYEEFQKKLKGIRLSTQQRSYNFMTEAGLPPDASLATPQAKVTEGLSSSVFEITAPATIPSDNSAHKVSIHMVSPPSPYMYMYHLHTPGVCGNHQSDTKV